MIDLKKINIFLLIYVKSTIYLFSSGLNQIENDYELDRKEISKMRNVKQGAAINILSIDGGGVRGIIPAIFLEKLEEKVVRANPSLKIKDLFDLNVGTSTGAIISLGLTTKKPNNEQEFRTASDMVKIYTTLSSEIFPTRGCCSRFWCALPALCCWKYKYSPEPLEKKLKDIVGDQELKDLNVPTVVTSVNLSSHNLKLFRSYRALWNQKENFLIRDVARATSAAPTYFPMKKANSLGDKEREISFVDGGIAANNPSVLALQEAFILFGNRPINLISLGTGERSGILHPTREWAYMRRAGPTIDMLFNSQSKAVDDALQNLEASKTFKINYYRVQIPLEEKLMDMDNAYNIGELSKLAHNHVERGAGKTLLDNAVTSIMDALEERK